MQHKFKKYTAVQYLQAVLIVTPFILLGVMALEYYLAHRPLTGSEIEQMQADSVDKVYSIDSQIKALKEIRKKFKPWVVQHRWMLTDVENSKDVRPVVRLIWNAIPEIAAYPVNEKFDSSTDFMWQNQVLHVIPRSLYGFNYLWTGLFKCPAIKMVNGKAVPAPSTSLAPQKFNEWVQIAAKQHDFIVASIYCPGKYNSQLWLSGRITDRIHNEVPIQVLIKGKEVNGSNIKLSDYQQVYPPYSFSD